jgi:tRNA dimethylallyltransferase
LFPRACAAGYDLAFEKTVVRRPADPGGHSRIPAGALWPDRIVDTLSAAAPLVAIVGPTASGKSDLAVRLAEEFHGAVVNYDSVQLYRGFDVGTAKLPAVERRSVPHYLLDCLDPGETFTAGDFRRAAWRALSEIRERGKLPVLAGGTGLYLRALLAGLFEGPGRSDELRERLRALAGRRGKTFVHRLLSRLDPESASRIGSRDLSKTIRAVEVCLLTGQPLSALQARGREGLRGFLVIKIGLDPDRAALYERIDRRVEKMFASGLVEEASRLLSRPDSAGLKPLGALGYRQACLLIRGEISLGEAIESTQKATRHYAKRQMTWFRREPAVTWFRGFADDPGVQLEIIAWLRHHFQPVREPVPVNGSGKPGDRT